MNAVILFGLFAVLIVLNVPIGISLAIASTILVFVADLPVDAIPANIYSASSKFTLLAIPFFVIAGNVMEKADISAKLIDFAKTMVGHRRNGISMVCVIVSCFFAAISGSGPATVAALGIIMIPAMANAGYGWPFSSALMAAGGAIGVIIPPSVTYIVYCSISDASIKGMFSSGIVPGLMMGMALIVASVICMRNRDIQHYEKAGADERWKSFKSALWGLLMPVIILGGIYTGFFTPTEAAAVSAVYGIFVGVFIYRTLKVKEMGELIIKSACQTGVVMFVMICASIFAYNITVDGIAHKLGELLVSFTGGNKLLFLLAVNIILLAAGCVIDAVSALYIFTPILLPVARMMRMDPIHFGIIMCVNLSIGLITPPVGVNLFTACGIAKISIREMIRDVIPLISALLFVLALVTYVPAVSMWLPEFMSNLMGRVSGWLASP
ncbi:MAG: TRAP transporter large permease [Planctomycetes bacterium]|nr:TRAP transporter large permease [Planctomycetota bacterium]